MGAPGYSPGAFVLTCVNAWPRRIRAAAGRDTSNQRSKQLTASIRHTDDIGRTRCPFFSQTIVFAHRDDFSGRVGARIVSGYLHNQNAGAMGSAGAGSTHAWAEVYVPGAGWITFDPTNHSVGNFNLIPVAVGCDIGQVIPVAGSFSGTNDALPEMSVAVEVTSS